MHHIKEIYHIRICFKIHVCKMILSSVKVSNQYKMLNIDCTLPWVKISFSVISLYISEKKNLTRYKERLFKSAISSKISFGFRQGFTLSLLARFLTAGSKPFIHYDLHRLQLDRLFVCNIVNMIYNP